MGECLVSRRISQTKLECPQGSGKVLILISSRIKSDKMPFKISFSIFLKNLFYCWSSGANKSFTNVRPKDLFCQQQLNKPTYISASNLLFVTVFILLCRKELHVSSILTEHLKNTATMDNFNSP